MRRSFGWRKAGGLLLLLGLHACRPESKERYRDVVVDYADRPVELVAGREVTQVFLSNHDQLTAVAVMLSNQGGRASGCEVVLRLQAKESLVGLHERRIDCATLPQEDWAELDFPPLPVTLAQRLVISIHSPNGQPGRAAVVSTASVPGIYPDGKLRVDDAVVPGSLRFMTFHR
jgi:hypothetical protein